MPLYCFLRILSRWRNCQAILYARKTTSNLCRLRYSPAEIERFPSTPGISGKPFMEEVHGIPMSDKLFKFSAGSGNGDVSAIMTRPENAAHLLVLGHGASSNMWTPLMQAIAEALAGEGIATFRYNFPYSENGRGRD